MGNVYNTQHTNNDINTMYKQQNKQGVRTLDISFKLNNSYLNNSVIYLFPKQKGRKRYCFCTKQQNFGSQVSSICKSTQGGACTFGSTSHIHKLS